VREPKRTALMLRVVWRCLMPATVAHRLCWSSGAPQVAALGRRRGTLRRLALRASGAYDPDVPLRFDLRPLAQARPSHERQAPHAPGTACGWVLHRPCTTCSASALDPAQTAQAQSALSVGAQHKLHAGCPGASAHQRILLRMKQGARRLQWPNAWPHAQAGLAVLEHFELSAAPGGRVTAAGLPALLRAAPALRAAALCGLACGGAALPPAPLGPDAVPSLGPAAAHAFAGVTATVTLVSAPGAPLGKDPGVAASAWPPAAVHAAAGLPPLPDGRAGAAPAAQGQARGAAQRSHTLAAPAAERSHAASSSTPVRLAAEAPGGPEVGGATWAAPRAAPVPGLSSLTSLELSAEDLGDLRGLAALPRLRALSLRALAPCRSGAARRGARGGAVLRADCVAALRCLERLALHSVRCPDGVRAPLHADTPTPRTWLCLTLAPSHGDPGASHLAVSHTCPLSPGPDASRLAMSHTRSPGALRRPSCACVNEVLRRAQARLATERTAPCLPPHRMRCSAGRRPSPRPSRADSRGLFGGLPGPVMITCILSVSASSSSLCNASPTTPGAQIASACLERVTATDLPWSDVLALAAADAPRSAAPHLRTLVVAQRARARAPDPALLQARPRPLPFPAAWPPPTHGALAAGPPSSRPSRRRGTWGPPVVRIECPNSSCCGVRHPGRPVRMQVYCSAAALLAGGPAARAPAPPPPRRRGRWGRALARAPDAQTVTALSEWVVEGVWPGVETGAEWPAPADAHASFGFTLVKRVPG